MREGEGGIELKSLGQSVTENNGGYELRPPS